MFSYETSDGAEGTRPGHVDDERYFYLGYLVTNEAEVQTFAKAYKERIAEGLPFSEDLPVPAGTGNRGGNTIQRLRNGVERLLITDTAHPAATHKALSEVPILIERPTTHTPAGGHVLFMDGHVEFRKFPGEWPMDEATINALIELDRPASTQRR